MSKHPAHLNCEEQYIQIILIIEIGKAILLVDISSKER